MHKTKTILIAAALILIAGGGFWLWPQKGGNEAEKTSPAAVSGTPEALAPAEVSETPAVGEVKDGLGAEAFNKTNNPLSNELPETNPFQVDTNPFK